MLPEVSQRYNFFNKKLIIFTYRITLIVPIYVR